MKLKTCTCGKHLKTRDVKLEGKCEGALYLTCKSCKSTFIILSKEMKIKIYGKAS